MRGLAKLSLLIAAVAVVTLVLNSVDLNAALSLNSPSVSHLSARHSTLSFSDEPVEPTDGGGNLGVRLNSPLNWSFENNSNVTFNFSVRGVNVTNCTLWTNQSGSWTQRASNASTVLSGSLDYGDSNFIYWNVSVSSLPSAVVWNVNCSNSSESALGDNASTLIAQPGTCGSLITKSITLNQSLNCSDSEFALAVIANDVVLDCNGSTIDGNGSTGFGVAVGEVNGVTVKNCTFSNFNESSAFFLNSSNSLYTNNTCTNSRSCIFTANSSNLTLSQNVFDNYSDFGVYGESTPNFTVSNSNFSNALCTSLKIQNASVCLVEGNRFSNINYSDGPLVSLESDDNCNFSSNTLQNLVSNGGPAVSLSSSSTSTISSNNLENLSSSNSSFSESAFEVMNPTGSCSVTQNTVRNASVGISIPSTSIPVSIQANNVYYAQDTAIWAGGVVDVRGNYLENSNNSGVSIQDTVATGTNITNNTINGTSSFNGAGINLWNASAHAWDNSIYGSPTAIRVSDSQEASTIEQNRVYYANDTGIRVTNATAVITSNYLLSSNVTGIAISDCGGHSVNVTYNTVNRTEYWDNGNGINAWACDGALIEGNSVNDTATGAIAVSNSSNAVINNNTVWRSTYQAIAVWSESQNTNITNNLIYDMNNTNGIVVEGFSFRTLVSGNYVFNYSSSGILVRNASNTTVSNNVIENKTEGSYSDGFFADSSPNTIVTGLTIINADTCLRATNSTSLSVYDSNCMQTAMLAHVNGSTSVNAVNTSYNTSSLGSVDDESSSLNVFFYLDLTVLNAAGSPVDGANVTIINFDAGTPFSGLTNSSGQIPRQLLSERFKNSTAETIKTPQNVTAWKTGHGTDTALVNLTQTFSVNLTMNLSMLPQVFFNSTTPASNFYNYTVVINASASDDALLNYTWIQVNSSNVSFTACGSTFCSSTAAFGIEGVYNVTGWANDTTNNINSTSTRSYTVDLTVPVVVLTSPVNLSVANTSFVTLDFSVTDEYYNYSLYYLNGTLQGTAQNGTAVALSADDYYLIQVVSFDKAGNSNSSTLEIWRAANATPVISGVNLTDLGTNIATVGWTTDIAATSLVEYGTTSSYGTNSTLDSALVTTHSVFLTGLSGGTLYYYRVWSCVGTHCAVSSGYTFTTNGGNGGGYGGGGGGGYIPAAATPTVETATPTATASATPEASITPTSEAGAPGAPGGEVSNATPSPEEIIQPGAGPFQGGLGDWLRRNAAAAGVAAAVVIGLLYFAFRWPTGPRIKR